MLKADIRRKLRHTFLGRENTIEALLLDNFYSAFSFDEQMRCCCVPPARFTGTTCVISVRIRDSLLANMLYADQKTYLVELLMKQDQMSMSCSIESRVPLLDHEFVEFATTIPDHLKIRGKPRNTSSKRPVEDLLPPEITYRKKMGFPTPLRQWLLDKRAEPLYSAIQDKSGFLAS